MEDSPPISPVPLQQEDSIAFLKAENVKLQSAMQVVLTKNEELLANRGAALTSSSDDDEIKYLREQISKKDDLIIILTNEVRGLRKQVEELSKSIKSSNYVSSESENEAPSENIQDSQSTKGRPKKRKNRTNSMESNKMRRAASVEKMDDDSSANNTQSKVMSTQSGKSNLTRPAPKDDFPLLPQPEKPVAPFPTATRSPPSTKIVPRPQRPKAIPPIIISNAGKFVSIANLFKANQINYSSAAVVRNGIKVFPCTEADYRKATKLLETHKEPFYTFRFPEEKLNHVVLRGVPTHLSKEEIAEDLSRQGFSPKNIIRWCHPDKKPMPLVLVLLPKAEKDIFKVKFVCTFEVSAEAQKTKPRSIQCYNCQDHGHAAPCCHIPPKCVKCGESHHTSSCMKTKEEPPKCANCAGDHPASFSGCPRHPSQLRAKQSSFKGWGTQDNSRLAPSKPLAPKLAPTKINEALLSDAQLAQITKLLTEQFTTLMTTFLANGRK